MLSNYNTAEILAKAFLSRQAFSTLFLADLGFNMG